jgi:putative addiction module killer protein
MQQEFEITSYEDESGNDHFSQWINSLEWKLQNIVFARLNRVKLGNFGDCESLGDKLHELRIHVGAGYRIYFSKEKNRIILLLCAGNKSSQKKDIQKAKDFLRRFYEKNKN